MYGSFDHLSRKASTGRVYERLGVQRAIKGLTIQGISRWKHDGPDILEMAMQCEETSSRLRTDVCEKCISDENCR